MSSAAYTSPPAPSAPSGTRVYFIPSATRPGVRHRAVEDVATGTITCYCEARATCWHAKAVRAGVVQPVAEPAAPLGPGFRRVGRDILMDGFGFVEPRS